ncbi:Hsp20/alpha crystallin family protein [Seonamhaeicola sp. ML3]|uniref:Hsp20/alpha crystallin family protein n=1 Tax=Seonamhaeicola sp. ML3 TaxID=2937786 RepID=UPI00200DC777|nr:Hsp20/alpha crystallin family protein [Seonamhaeicola sp. ML3]
MTTISPKPKLKDFRFKETTENQKQKNTLKFQESENGYHYQLDIPGYIKEDFRFYLSRNQLVITTEKDSETKKTKSDNEKHSYCYPSALFKMNITLPKKPVEKRITAEYRNETLYFSLYKI